jgi:hypothetical protein
MEPIQLTPLDKNQSLLQRIFVFFLGVLFHIYIIIEKIRGVRKDPKRVKQSDCIFCKCQSNEVSILCLDFLFGFKHVSSVLYISVVPAEGCRGSTIK